VGAQQALDRLSVMPSVTKKRTVDEKSENLEDVLGKHSGTSRESLCWFSVEIPNSQDNIRDTNYT